jgi:RHS repeat-associated protein
MVRKISFALIVSAVALFLIPAAAVAQNNINIYTYTALDVDPFLNQVHACAFMYADMAVYGLYDSTAVEIQLFGSYNGSDYSILRDYSIAGNYVTVYADLPYINFSDYRATGISWALIKYDYSKLDKSCSDLEGYEYACENNYGSGYCNAINWCSEHLPVSTYNPVTSPPCQCHACGTSCMTDEYGYYCIYGSDTYFDRFGYSHSPNSSGLGNYGEAYMVPSQWVTAGIYTIDEHVTLPAEWNTSLTDWIKVNNGIPGCAECVGEPVNITNGNMSIEQTDYTASGLAKELNLVRTYNSHSEEEGMFGLGWSALREESLQIISALHISVDYGDGKIVYYARSQISDTTFYPEMPKDDQSHVDIDEENYLFTLILKSGEKHLFNTNGEFSSGSNLAGIIDRNNNLTNFVYDTNGRLTKIVDPAGRNLSFTYNESGFVSSITDGVEEGTNIQNYDTSMLGQVATYAYYPSTNRLMSVSYSRTGSQYQFEYTLAAIAGHYRLTTVKDANGNILEAHEYDSSSGYAITSHKSGDIELYTMNYISDTRTDVTDALGRITRNVIDKSQGNGRFVVTAIYGPHLTTESEPAPIQRHYDSNLNLTSVVDQLGHTTSYTYDTEGNMLTVSRPVGVAPNITTQTTTYTYNSDRQILTETDAMGGITNTYDSHGNLHTRTIYSNSGYNPSNTSSATTTYGYDSRGLLTSIAEPSQLNRNPTIIAYDAFGNMVSTTDAMGHVTPYWSDVRGRRTNAYDWYGNETTFAYDAKNRLIYTEYPDASYEEKFYNYYTDKLDESDDANGNPTFYTYDSAGRLIEVWDGVTAHGPTVYNYDSMSNVISVTDPEGHPTATEYYSTNQVKKITYPDATPTLGRRVKLYEYDAAGHVTTECYKIQQSGSPVSNCLDAEFVTTFVPDASGRVLSKTERLDGSTNYTTSMSYDPHDNMTGLTDATGNTYAYVYDYSKKLQYVSRYVARDDITKTMQYWYDTAGNIVQRQDYNSAVTTYIYDSINRLVQISYPNSQTVTYWYHATEPYMVATNAYGQVTTHYDTRNRMDLITDIFNQTITSAYDGNGNRTSRGYGNVTTTYEYDNRNLMLNMTENGLSQAAFAYDDDGKLHTKTLDSLVTATYGYDDLEQISSIGYVAGQTTLANFSYTPDVMGRITNVTDPGGQHTFTNDNMHRLTAATHSNMASESYQYDGIGNMLNSNLTFPPPAGVSYGYDYNGNRTSKTVGSSVWQYAYDYENRLTQVTPPTGPSIFYAYDALGRRVARSFGDYWTAFGYDGADVLWEYSAYDSSTIWYGNGPGIDNKLWMHQFQGSSPITVYFLTDHQGSTRALISDTGGIVSGSLMDYDSFGNSSGTVGTRYRYTGREWDADAQLYYYRARYYDPAARRFISEDPIGLEGGINLYAYVENNPVNFTDPMGLQGIEEAIILQQMIAPPPINPSMPRTTVQPGSPEDLLARGINGGIGLIDKYIAHPIGDQIRHLFAKNCEDDKDQKSGKKAEDSSKGERHGDGGRKLDKVQKQIEDLTDRLADATKKEAKKIKIKIQHIIEAAKKAKKGDTDWRK